MKIKLQLINASLSYPEYAHTGDAGLDLRSSVNASLKPFERKLIPTGIKLEIPQGFAGFVLPRSGLAINNGVSLVNAPGLIDSNYRGEIKAILINFDQKEPFVIKENDRICQLVILRVESIELIATSQLQKTIRNEHGFGSTGSN